MDRAGFDRIMGMLAVAATRRRALEIAGGALAAGLVGRSLGAEARQATPTACRQTSPAENVAIVRRWFEVAYTPHDPAKFADLEIPNVVHHSPTYSAQHDSTSVLAAVLGAFPDLQATLDDVVAADELVAVRFTMSGTQTGPFLGAAPTDAPVRFAGINLFRFECGKIAEVWNETDVLGVLRQTGALPAQPALATPPAATAPAASPTACPTSTPEENAAMVKRFWDILSGGDLATLAAVLTPDEVHHWGFSADTVGVAAYAQRFAAFRAAFPDFTFRVDRIVAEGDRAVSLWTATGTHQGAWMGIAPTGKTIDYTGINEFRFACGKIAEGWGLADHVGLLRQIGGLSAELDMGTPVAAS